MLLGLPSRLERLTRRIALAMSGFLLINTVFIWHFFSVPVTAMQFEERYLWIPALHVDYHVGVDGVGLLMLVLSAIVVLISIAASGAIQERVRLYFALILLLESCLFGAFTALNFVHWFTYWELSLIPAFFLIKLWGGEKRTAAATHFLVYTMVGSVATFIGFIALYAGSGTFEFLELAQRSQRGTLMPSVITSLSLGVTATSYIPIALFVAVFLGFAVKVPLMPFHTWLPAAYAEAPTGATILLTGAMSKMGVYGFLRVLLPIFGPQMQRCLTPLLWLAVASVVVSTFAALAQRDLKRIFAYSSINHLGYCLLGLFAAMRWVGADSTAITLKTAAISGVVLQMFNHGLTAATIFWCIAMIEIRTGGRRGLDDFGGLRRVAPVFTGLMGIALFSSLGLPGLNGFIGEFLIFRGSFPLVPRATALCLLGLFFTVIFILGVMQKVFSGPLNPTWERFPDLTMWEKLGLAPLIALMFCLGLCPQFVLGLTNNTVFELVRQIPLSL